MTATVISSATAADIDAVSTLLRDSQLPVEGLSDHLGTLFVARRGAAIVGSAALEMYADGALLRSVVVAPDARGLGVGRDLTTAAISRAREQRVPAIYLLTTTAERYFPKWGFERIERADVPPMVRTSVEFVSACPASATVMRKAL